MQDYVIQNPEFQNLIQFREKLMVDFGSSYFILKNWEKEQQEDEML